MKFFFLSLMFFLSLSSKAQLAVYDAATNAQAAAAQSTNLAKYVEMVTTMTNTLNAMTNAVSMLTNLDKKIFEMNANLKCAFDQTSLMIEAKDRLEKKIKDVNQGKIFLITRGLIEKVNSTSGVTFNSLNEITNYVHANYENGDGEKIAKANKINANLAREIQRKRVQLVEDFLDNESERLVFLEGQAKSRIEEAEESNQEQANGMVNGKPISVCGSSQQFTMQRLMMAQYEIQAFNAELDALDLYENLIRDRTQSINTNTRLKESK